MEVIRDWKTGDSLSYAFIEFATKEACEQAYFKMDNVSIDDRRIHVDFSQSLSRQAISKDGRLVNTFGFNFMNKANSSGAKKSSKESKDSDLKVKDNSRSRGNYSLVFDEEDHQPRQSSKQSDRSRDHKDRDKDRKHSSDKEYRHNRDKEHKNDKEKHKEHKHDREKDYKRDERENKKRKY